MVKVGEYIERCKHCEDQKGDIEKPQEEKEYPKQTYDELIRRMIEVYEEAKKRNHSSEFLHNIQQPKMKGLWDNPDDEAWEDV